ncbi:MAG: LacI family DNA-binding transcriptional regulator [Anaerolineae bacterium]|nr:LacI family DNA-binding transcriptional regulator [Anaerolineae bacterium]
MSLTLEEVGQLAGVSRSTVSRVINEQPNVRPETKERVQQVIHKAGYQPNAIARSLVTSRTKIIGMIIPETVTKIFTDPFFPLLLCGCTRVCKTHHYQLLLSLFNVPEEQERDCQQILYSGYLDGAIVASHSLEDSLIPSVSRSGLPIVSIGRHPDKQIHYVDSDNVGGAQMATEHLIRLGHRHIATITGRLEMTAGQDRLAGYRQALLTHGILPQERLIAKGDFTENSGALAMQRLLPVAPTAVFAANDMMAVGALKTLRAVGLQVPKDIAVIGFDDVSIASMVEPTLTTVRQPIERMGAVAVDLLLSLLQGSLEKETEPHKIILPTELVIRNSCGSILN